MNDMSFCRSCKKPIRWVRMAGSGKANPLDLETRPDGNIVMDEEGEAVYVRKGMDVGTADRFVSHFSTCEFADQHRRAS